MIQKNIRIVGFLKVTEKYNGPALQLSQINTAAFKSV